MEYAADIRCLTSTKMFQGEGRTPYEMLTGNTPDISEYVEFEWYGYVWYVDPQSFPQQRVHMGRWLGVAHRVGQGMCYYLLKHNGQVIVRSSVTVVTMAELETEDVKTKADILDKSITESIGDYNKSIVKGSFVEEYHM